MILSAARDSPTFASFGSMLLVPTCMPTNTDRTTKASQPKTAVFQWLALQRPIRAAKLFECFRGDICCSFSALRLQVVGLAQLNAEAEAPAGREREWVVEGRERVGACDVELELLVAAWSRRP